MLTIRCGGGTYIRSLAHDIGRDLGCGAHLSALERTGVGPFKLEHARTVDQVSGSFVAGKQVDVLLAPDYALHLPEVEITTEQLAELRFGRFIRLDRELSGDALYRTYVSSGAFVGVLKRLSSGELAVVKLMSSGT